MLKCLAVSVRLLVELNSSTLFIRLSLYFLVKEISVGTGVSFLSSGVSSHSVLKSSVFKQSWLDNSIMIRANLKC